VTSYIVKWFTRLQVITHPSANPAVHLLITGSMP